jgi:oligo-alginate lyase
MKSILPILLCVSLLGSVSPLSAQEPQPRGPHPRLFFTAERIAKLQERIKTEPTTAEAWAKILADPKTIEELSLAYRMTGEKRFADRARGAVGKLRYGDNALMKRNPPWHSGLGTARSCYESAVAYDSIYDALTPEERAAMAKGMIEKGILPTLEDWVLGSKRIHALDSMGHNWWSACVFGAGMASLAVMDEEPRAKDWLERISDGSVEWLEFAGSLLDNKPKSFDAGGAFYEDVNYASFAVSQYLLFRLAWNQALATPAAPELPMLDTLGDYFLNVSYLNSGRAMNLNFGDGGLTADTTSPLVWLWANGYRKPRHLWYLHETSPEQHHRDSDRSSAMGLVFFPTDAELASVPAAPDLPPSALYGDIGWASLRSSWDRNATLLGVKSGYTWNHAHADAGSFVLFHEGENILIESGKCTYGRPEYDGYYRQSQAHNVVLFNGAAQNPEDTAFGSKFPGTVSHLMDTGDLKYVLADATGPTSHLFIRNYRHFLWLGDVILIIDDLKTFEEGQFEWLLHVDGVAKQKGEDLEVTKGAAKVLVRPLFPKPLPIGYPADFPEHMKLVERVGLKDRQPDTEQTYYAFAPPGKSRRTKFITAVFLVTEANRSSLPQLERLEGPDYIGVSVSQNGKTTDVYLNLRADGSIMHRNGNLKVNGWETDAYLTAITFPDGMDKTDPDEASRYFIAQGSYLRRDDKVVLDSLSKLFLVAERSGADLSVLLQGQPTINAYFRSAQPPETLVVNQVNREALYDAARKRVKISVER